MRTMTRTLEGLVAASVLAFGATLTAQAPVPDIQIGRAHV